MTDFIKTAAVRINGDGGDEVEAYVAGPDGEDEATRPGIVLIHHLPGYDRWTKEVARRFATDGYTVIVPNLYFREAPGADPDDAAAAARAQGGVPDDRLVGDVRGAVEYLRQLPSATGRVAVMGHCSGGRHAVLAACHLPVNAAVDCYGAHVMSSSAPGSHMRAKSLADALPGLSAPLLGLFGREDTHPGPDEVQQLDDRLTELGKEHEFHLYDNAGHAFFAADRPTYRVAASLEAYPVLGRFLQRTLVAA